MTKKVRKDFRISPTLVRWLKKYASACEVSETYVIEQALRLLQEKVDGSAPAQHR